MYETGLLVALLLWLWSSVWLLVMLNSRLQKNLGRVGMCLSWTTLQPRRMTPADRRRGPLGSLGRYLIVVVSGLCLVLLSWIYVAIWAGFAMFRRYKDAGKPAAVREFDWKMRNLDMGFEQIAREMYALHSAMSLEPPGFEQFKSDLWQQAFAE